VAAGYLRISVEKNGPNGLFLIMTMKNGIFFGSKNETPLIPVDYHEIKSHRNLKKSQKNIPQERHPGSLQH